MSERDELAKALSEHEYIAFEDDRNTWECECLTVMSHDPSKPGHMEHLADAILAAGYRKPRTVATAAELDALPVGSVVVDCDETACQKSHDYFDRKQWYAVGVEYAIAKPELPAIVLHEGSAS